MNQDEKNLLNKKLDLILEMQIEQLKEKSNMSIIKYYNTYEELQKEAKMLGLE